MSKKEKVKKIIRLLKKEYPDVKIALKFKNPFQLLIATILSAQCRDERVNSVTEKLFEKYKTPEDFAKVDLDTLAEDIKSTGFYRQKAKYIKEACEIIVKKFGGQVPETMEGLLELPGVARKTANIVLSEGFGKPQGIAVDTHVRRLSQRLGLTDKSQSEKIEKDLMEIVPQKEWRVFPLLLQAHGRKVCTSRKPKCEKCILKELCDAALSSH